MLAALLLWTLGTAALVAPGYPFGGSLAYVGGLAAITLGFAVVGLLAGQLSMASGRPMPSPCPSGSCCTWPGQSWICAVRACRG